MSRRQFPVLTVRDITGTGNQMEQENHLEWYLQAEAAGASGGPVVSTRTFP